jgi:hypothetical protein
MITMLLGGLWHGAAWTYVVWGGLHGLYLICNHGWNKVKPPITIPVAGHALAVALTFSCVVSAWVFFRAPSLDAAITMLRGMAGMHGFATAGQSLASKQQILALAGMVAICWFAPNAYQMLGAKTPALQETRPAVTRAAWTWQPSLTWAIVLGILAALALSQMLSGAPSEFIYFQF